MWCQHNRARWCSWAGLWGLLMLSMTSVHAQNTPTARVIGGNNVTSVTTYPWMGFLKVRKTTAEQTALAQCGASFISDEWVLTAAHCLADKDWLASASDVSVYEGQLEQASFTAADEHVVSQVYVHRSYDPGTQNNDIALLRLSVRYSGTSLSLAQEGEAQQALVAPNGLRILGWGKTSNSATQGSAVLQTALLTASDSSACQVAWPGIPDTAFCAQGASLGNGQFIDSCFGDSGGPLISAATPTVQVGIVSAGTQNCGSGTPSIYTRITSYRTWISGIQDGSITEVYAPGSGSGGGTVTPPTTDNCQIGGGIECGPGEGGGSFPLWTALFLPLIYVLRRRKHA